MSAFISIHVVNLFKEIFLFILFVTFPDVLSERGLINKNSIFEKHQHSPSALNLADETSFTALASFSSEELKEDNMDVTLLGTADGFLHAINPSTHEKIWSTDIGGPLLSSHQKKSNDDFAVYPNLDGSLLIHSNEGMRKTSVKARLLAEKVRLLLCLYFLLCIILPS
jgi:hypothetical protein